ncbi:unnamed protein product [Mytilus edulis]|uniref:Uncharacterized protein n=1 Tax=Mytilus edulis TaxID=6550 RepID=A0A8S3Q571_MYTED|nr:unnamed protein product [Mytilus edulis]
MAGIEDNTDSASSTTSEMINTADTDKRLRTLTESGKELFENKQRKFLLKMQIVKSDLQLLARNIEPYSNELTSLQELKTEFMSGTVRYDTICKEYLDFLSRTNTAEGMDEVHKLSVLARARAKAEAAKVKVHFAEKETLLLKEKALIEEKRSIESAKVERKKADIEADLDLLSRQKEAAAVEAEANALQNECDENMSQVLPDQPPLDSKSKTAAYINHVQKQISSIEIDKENTDAFHIDKENKHSTHIDQENTHVSGTLDPHANSFIPRKNIIADTHVSDNHPYPSDRTLATDFTRFLLKRDLLMSSQQANTGFKDKLPTTKGKLNDVRTRKTDFAETKNERSQSVDPRAKNRIHGGTVRYDTICKEYLDFLSRTNTAEGMDEVHKLSGEMQDFTQFVETEKKETLLLKEKALIEEKRSIESAKVERKKADIEADLDLLSRQKEAAAVEAEANALQNECDENMSQVLPDQPPLDSKSKTAAYINHVQKQISSIEIDKENTDAFHIDKENKHSTHIDQENTHVSEH